MTVTVQVFGKPSKTLDVPDGSIVSDAAEMLGVNLDARVESRVGGRPAQGGTQLNPGENVQFLNEPTLG